MMIDEQMIKFISLLQYLIVLMSSNQDEKVNWVTVINFLEKEYNQISIREKEWRYQKQMMIQRIAGLQAELRSSVVVCQNLVNRIRILQLALKEERNKKAVTKTMADPAEIASLLQKFNLNKQIEKSSHESFLNDVLKDFKVLADDSKRIVERNQMQEVIDLHRFKRLSQKKKIGAHLDVVTNLVSLQVNHQQMVASCSQDCLIKIWNLPSLLKEDNPEPKHTLRKHTGPLFSLAAGPNILDNSQSLLFSGGIEGDIKSWKIDKHSVQWTGSWLNGTSQQQQTIWQLEMMHNKLLSASSDGIIRMFKIQDNFHKIELTPIQQFKQKQFNQTALYWVTEEIFLAGCSSAPRIHLWSVEGKLSQKYLYQSEKGKDALSLQVNRLCMGKELKLVMAGCQDGVVRLFDYTSSKMTKKLQCQSAVSTVLNWDWQIVVGDHKGSLSFWDARTFKLIQSKQSVHLTKYQTGITCALFKNHLFTSGADGIIKIFN